MSNDRIKLRFFRRVLGVALCYALAFQALLFAYGTALAVGQLSDPAASFIICHNVGAETPVGPNTSKPVTVPCALCATAASASGLLPAPAFAVVAPSIMAGRIAPIDIAVIVGSPPVRAGLARAPPRFA